MRLLLVECVPRALKRALPGHDVNTVQEMGWAGSKNGVLLRLANADFDALLTVDQGLEYQQDLAGLKISVVVLVGASNDIDDLHHLIPEALEVLRALQSGQLVRVGG